MDNLVASESYLWNLWELSYNPKVSQKSLDKCQKNLRGTQYSGINIADIDDFILEKNDLHDYKDWLPVYSLINCCADIITFYVNVNPNSLRYDNFITKAVPTKGNPHITEWSDWLTSV
jgi:hypothetical protein